ncbi:MAG: hypothetical protein Crog4KO_24760 [Crocinitomicaceae bacterium]
MNLSNNELDQLFENVRQEKPVATFDETQRAFVAATIATAGGVLATKGLLKMFTFKQWIMMISVLSAATVGTLLVGMSSSPVTADENQMASAELPKKEISVVEIEKETDESEKTVEKLTPLKSLTASIGELLTNDNGAVYARRNTPIQVVAYRLDDGSYKFVYKITPNTTEEDLKRMQQEAKDSGFELEYTASFNDNKLETLNLEITQEKANGTKQNIHISDIDLTEEKEYKIAWDVDDEGQATTIAIDDSYRSNEVDELLAELNLEGIPELENLEILMENEVALLEELHEIELAEVGRALEEAEALLEDSEMRERLIELDELDEEELAEAMRGIREAREGLAECEEELLAECNKLQAECDEIHRKCKEGHEKIITELLNDDLIQEKEKRIKMQLKKGKMTVNGKEIPKNLRKKYEALVQEYFEIDTDQKGLQWTWTHKED